MTNRSSASWIASLVVVVACGARTPLGVDGLVGAGIDGANDGGANAHDGATMPGDDGVDCDAGQRCPRACASGFVPCSTGCCATPIATGTAHTCVVTRVGRVECWGYGVNGQLGDGNGSNSAFPVVALKLDLGVTGLAATDAHTCAIAANGGAQCWGHNYFGELGNGTADSFIPAGVVGLSGVVQITAGSYDSCAVTRDGSGWCWGQNRDGELGDGTNVTVDSPVGTRVSQLVAIAAGRTHACGLSSSGRVQCWGDNTVAELGDGTNTNSFAPVDVVGLDSGVAAITAGGRHTCVLMRSGGVRCWGDNHTGALGNGTLRDEMTPFDVVGLDVAAVAIATGDSHTCAVMADASARCWGSNERGQLGDGTTTARYVPVRVVGLDSARSIAPGALHTCAVVADGSAFCWGSNEYGQLGNGGPNDSSIPVRVPGI